MRVEFEPTIDPCVGEWEYAVTVIRIDNGFRKAIVNSFGDVAQFTLTAVEDVGDGTKIMLAEIDGMQVWDHLPIRRQSHVQQSPKGRQEKDFFGAPLADAFKDAAWNSGTIMAVHALDELADAGSRDFVLRSLPDGRFTLTGQSSFKISPAQTTEISRLNLHL